MPHYDYRCLSCDFIFEKLQKMTDAPLKECPSCSELSAVRIPSAGIGLNFRGKGFYITDYGQKNGLDSSCLCGKEKS